MKRLLALFVAAWLGACGTAPGPAGPSQANKSAAISWRHTGSHSFEKQSPGLGVSHKYESSAGLADVYVYGLRRSNWVPGVADAQFKSHFESTIAEVQGMARRGDYAQLEVGPVRDVRVGAQSFRTVSFRFMRGGKPIESFTYLTAFNGQLVKYRISFNLPAAVDPATLAKQFVEQNMRDGPGGPGV